MMRKGELGIVDFKADLVRAINKSKVLHICLIRGSHLEVEDQRRRFSIDLKEAGKE